MKFKKMKLGFLLSFIIFLIGICLFEIKEQWCHEKNNFNPYELIEKIVDTDIQDLKEIRIFEVGSLSSLFQNKTVHKIKVKTDKEEIWSSEMDSYLYRLFLDEMKAKADPKKNQLIVCDKNFWNQPLTIVMHPILHFMSTISSVIFMFYIIGNMKTSKSKDFKISSKQKSLFTFKDIAGNEEEKEEMKELIDFLKQPQKYQQVGALIPKGVLLEGPPGTGKTLLVKALAGEANVPFYAVSGSEFVEMYVGVGASRVRKLFKEVKDNAPCVLFIDEIDVLGGTRGGNFSGGSQEKDQTLNQLLTEMDGFTKSLGIIVVGATNRIDILDSALLRPGRFDRKIFVSLPDVKAREAILKLHAKNKNISKDVNFHQLAKQTPGMSGAELAAVLNEACIWTVRNQKNLVTMEDLDEAIDRVLMGPAKKSRKYSEEEKKETAYHEAGHAVIALKLKDADKVQKITIIPRGSAGGYNLILPEKELFFHSKKRFKAKIISYLGGRAAEELVFGPDNTSSGCYDDFKQVTRIAKAMVIKYGMSDLGPVQDSEFSDKKAIDQEIKKIIDQCFVEAQTIMKDNRALLDKIANLLLEQETITKEEIDKLVEI